MFYDHFSELCKQKGISVTRATEEIGLARTIGTKWKNTGSTPNGATLAKIAEYFNVSVSYLLGEQEKPTITGEQIKELRKEVSDSLPTMSSEDLLAMMTEITEILKKRGSDFSY